MEIIIQETIMVTGMRIIETEEGILDLTITTTIEVEGQITIETIQMAGEDEEEMTPKQSMRRRKRKALISKISK